MVSKYLMILSFVFIFIFVIQIENIVSLNTANKLYFEVENASTYMVTNVESSSDIRDFISELEKNDLMMFFKDVDGLSVVGASDGYFLNNVSQGCDLESVEEFNTDYSNSCSLKHFSNEEIILSKESEIFNGKVGYINGDTSNVDYVTAVDVPVVEISDVLNISVTNKIIFVTLMFSYVAAFIVSLESKKMKIGVLHSLGYATAYIYKKVVLSEILVGLWLSLSIVSVLRFAVNLNSVYLVDVFTYVLLFGLVMTLLVVLLSVIITFVYLNKSYYHSRNKAYVLPRFFNYVAKFICVVLILVQVTRVVEVNRLINLYKSNETIKVVSDYYYIFGSSQASMQSQQTLLDYSNLDKTKLDEDIFFYGTSYSDSDDHLDIIASSNLENVKKQEMFLLPSEYNYYDAGEININYLDLATEVAFGGSFFIKANNEQEFYEKYSELLRLDINENSGLIVKSIGDTFSQEIEMLNEEFNSSLLMLFNVILIYLSNYMVEFILYKKWKYGHLVVMHSLGFTVVQMIRVRLLYTSLVFIVPVLLVMSNGLIVVVTAICLLVLQLLVEYFLFSYQIRVMRGIND